MRKCVEKYGDFEDWTLNSMHVDAKEVKIVNPKSQNLPDFKNVQGIIITGSHDMVTDEFDWIKKSSAWLKEATKNNLPIFGICFGHQLLAQTFGGIVDNHPVGPEIGTVSVTLHEKAKSDALFKNLPENFLVHVTHTQSVLKLPKNAVLLASNCYESCHAFRIKNNIWGVQFHPEYNADILKEYVFKEANRIKNVPIVLKEICETLYANSLIEKFVEFCKEKN
jgi:GMP synthase (glutamine-hydrolysing)